MKIKLMNAGNFKRTGQMLHHPIKNNRTAVINKLITVKPKAKTICFQRNSMKHWKNYQIHKTYHWDTSFPRPQNAASSSIPSSMMTVLSTSKQTASAFFHTCFACWIVIVVKYLACLPKFLSCSI